MSMNYEGKIFPVGSGDGPQWVDNGEWVPIDALAFLLRGAQVRACSFSSMRTDIEGRAYLSLAESADVECGDLLVPVSARRCWRVIEVGWETVIGVVMQKRAFCQEEITDDAFVLA